MPPLFSLLALAACAWSQPVNLYAPAATVGSPSAPAAASLSPLSGTSLRLEFAAPPSDGGALLTSYRVEWDPAAAVPEVQLVTTALQTGPNEVQRVQTLAAPQYEVQTITTSAASAPSIQTVRGCSMGAAARVCVFSCRRSSAPSHRARRRAHALTCLPPPPRPSPPRAGHHIRRPRRVPRGLLCAAGGHHRLWRRRVHHGAHRL